MIDPKFDPRLEQTLRVEGELLVLTCECGTAHYPQVPILAENLLDVACSLCKWPLFTREEVLPI